MTCSFRIEKSLGAAALVLLLVGNISCGDQSKPDAIGQDELKPAHSFVIRDDGNGAVRLSWSGSNYNKDFSGYNVYGAKRERLNKYFADGSLAEGTSLRVLGDDGENVPAALAILSAMSYDPNTKFDDHSTPKDNAFLPLHREAGAYPTCRPIVERASPAGSICKWTELDGPSKGPFSGKTYLDLNKLTVGTQYCFIVLSTLDKGKKIASVSSELRCIVPQLAATITIAADQAIVAPTKGIELPLNKWAHTCAKGDAACIKQQEISRRTKECTANTETGVCIERFRSGIFQLTAGKNSGIIDAGYSIDGFHDQIPKVGLMKGFSLHTNQAGFAPPAHSIPLLMNHVYVVAEVADNALSSFYYHKIFVRTKNDQQGTLIFDLRLATVADQL